MSGRGGHIVVERRAVGGPERRGEIVEVLGQPGRIRYRVRWEGGLESIVYPGGGLTVEGVATRRGRGETQPRAAGGPPAAKKSVARRASVPDAAVRARRGDRLVIRAHHLGEPRRDAEILEVLGKRGAPPYRVRWQDSGHESIVFPGADAFVEHFEHKRPTQARGRVGH